MLLSEKPNVIFFRPKKMGGGGVCVLGRDRKYSFCLGHLGGCAGHCTGLTGSEPHRLKWHFQGHLLKEAGLQGQGSGA